MTRHWFEDVAAHLGPAYLRYSFTKGTEQEVDMLVEALDLQPGERVLDVGCGPGRHALALARRGFDVVGVDISADFIALARAAALDQSLNLDFRVRDARDLVFLPRSDLEPEAGSVQMSDGELSDENDQDELELEGQFDACISLCQGAFGLAGGPGAESDLPRRELDEPILASMANALRPGGRLAVSAFSSYFMIRYLEQHDTFDAETGVNHETTTLRDEQGHEVESELWTTCFTPRELRLLARSVGLTPKHVYGVTPGKYEPVGPSLDVPEFLLLAERS